MGALLVAAPIMSDAELRHPGLEATALRFSRHALAVLAEAGGQLTGVLTTQQVIDRVSKLLIPELAEWFVMVLPARDGCSRLVGYAHHNPAREAELALLADAVQTWDVSALARLKAGSAVCIPLSSDGSRLGTLLLAPSAADPDLLQELGQRIAAAVQTARTVETARVAAAQADELLAVAAHELRTPIAVLSGYTQLLQRQLARGAAQQTTELRSMVSRLDNQSRRLSRLVTNLLEATRANGGTLELQRERADFAQVVREVVERARIARPHRRITLEASGPAPVHVDIGRVEQVLSNLIDNACKFSPAHTSVGVRVQSTTEGGARLSVRDRGPGVPPEMRERIFERFVQAQAHRPAGGLGLGLFISRQIVELHGGALRAHFPRDGGSRFVVELPPAE